MSGGVALSAETALPTVAEIKSLMDGGKYREALKPLFRLLELKGTAAVAYDRYELLMLRAECQIQIHEQQATLETLELARKEAFAENEPKRAAEPTALALLIERSKAYQYKPRDLAGAKAISILDKTLRPAAYAALLADELPGAKQKVKAINNARSIEPVVEAARVVGGVHALEVVCKPDAAGGASETDPLVSMVTTNADRLFSGAIAEMSKTADLVSKRANVIYTDQVGYYDPVSKRSWVQPVQRRRGVSNQDAQTLANINGTCDKINATIVELAVGLATDFASYREMAGKAVELKKQVAAIQNEDYTVVPP